MSIVTRIHGEHYDLTGFAHPGGTIPLKLIGGRDGTALFELYHPLADRAQLRSRLERFRIDPPEREIEAQDSYDFSDFDRDPFVIELRARVRAYFEALARRRGCGLIEATKAPWAKHVENVVAFCAFAASCVFLARGHWLATLTTPLCYWIYLVGMWHDGGHFALCANKKAEFFLYRLFVSPLMSSGRWYATHSHRHHAYPNRPRLDGSTEAYYRDWSIKTPLKRLLRSAWSGLVRRPQRERPAPGADGPPLGLRSLREHWHGFRLTRALNLAAAVIFVKFVILDNLLLRPTPAGLAFLLLPLTILIALYAFFTMVNHLHQANFTRHRNLFRHQVITSYNFCCGSYWMRLVSGGLNCQIEHHLFPSVNSWHLPALAPIVKRACRAHGVPYREAGSFREAVTDTLRALRGRPGNRDPAGA